MDFSTVLSVAQTLYSALQCSELKEFSSIFDYKSKLNDLQRTVATIQAVLRDAETKQELSEQELLYIEELKDAVYEADDLFDEFITLAEKKKLNDDSKVRFLSAFKEFGVAYKMSQGVNNIKKKLDAIASIHTQFSFKLDHNPIRNRRPETCSYVYADHIVGREDDVENIVGMLLDSSAKTKIYFLSVVGIGGLGKTALAQLVYNDQRISNAFPLRLWTCVSDEGQKPFDTQAILANILSSVAKTTRMKYDFSTMDLIQSQLLPELVKGQYFLVLDDVWTENRDEWLKLAEYLMGGHKGSWVIVTTRSKETARIIGDGEMYELHGLSEESSWHLFKEVAFVSKQSNPPDDLVNIGQQIARRCVGVPLAIRVAGSFLYGQDKIKWLLFQDIGLAKFSESKKGIMPILKLSYDNLDTPLKSCFSYCALFPKDYLIRKKFLVRLWIAQGYIVPFEKGQSLEDAAYDCICILLRRCFFQDVKRDMYGEIHSFKIHDLMHDIAEEVSALEVNGGVRHLSLMKDDVFNGTLSTNARLRTYIQYGNVDHPLVNELLAKCVCLRTLVLRESDIISLPDSIGKLLHLRYLDLSWNQKLQVLPNTITKLHNLETLLLYNCISLKELPEMFDKLLHLKYLDLSRVKELQLQVLPNTIVKLHKLETLVLDGFTSLKKLPKMLGKLLHLRYLDLSGNEKLQVLPNTITKLHNLETLKLHSCRSLKELPEKMGNLVKLRGLDIRDCKGLTYLPSSLGGLTELQILGMFMVGIASSSTVKKFHDELEMLNALNSLRGSLQIKIRIPEDAKYIKKDDKGGAYLRRKEYLEDIWIWFCGDRHRDVEYEEALLEELQPHSNLKELVLWGYNGGILPNWAKQDNLATFLPHLVHLDFYECWELRCLPRLGKLRHLESLRISDLPELEYVEGDRSPAPATWASGGELPLFPSLQKLYLTRLPKLKGWWGRSSVDQSHVVSPSSPALPQLKILEIEDCPELTYFPWCPPKGEHLTALECLSIRGSPKIKLKEEEEGIPWRSLSHNLRFLILGNLPQLVNLPAGMQCLTSLHFLEIRDCNGPEFLPDWMSNLTSLKQLYVYSCSSGLYERCQRPDGEDWPNIQHIPDTIIR